MFSTFSYTPNQHLVLEAALFCQGNPEGAQACVTHRKALADTTPLLTWFKALSTIFTFIL